MLLLGLVGIAVASPWGYGGYGRGYGGYGGWGRGRGWGYGRKRRSVEDEGVATVEDDSVDGPFLLEEDDIARFKRSAEPWGRGGGWGGRGWGGRGRGGYGRRWG